MSLTSDEVNTLVYRYLLESGFTHTAFAFNHEAHLAKAPISMEHIPPGSLVTYIQKGLQFDEIEAHINEDGTEILCDQPFSVIHKHECRMKTKRRLFDPDVPIYEDYGSFEVPKASVSSLQGHVGIITACSWSKSGSHLASSSADGTVRLWTASSISHTHNGFDPPSSKVSDAPQLENGDADASHSVLSSVLDVNEFLNERNSSELDAIISLAWSPDNTHIASGTIGGAVYLWDSSSARLKPQIARVSGSITCIKFNPCGDYLLGCAGGSSVIYSKNLKGAVREYQLHDGTILDADWKDDFIFATCGRDHGVHVCDVREESTIRSFVGHTAEVNAVQWDPDGQVLATASDDKSVKVWDLESERPVYDFKDHEREITSLSWSSSQSILASASLDTTTRLWDIQTGSCTRVLDKHVHPVILVRFSCDGKQLATASNDRVFVWSCNSGSMISTHKCPGGINDLSWDPSGTRMSLACSNNNLSIIDLRM